MSTNRPWLNDVILGLLYYFFTTLVVVLGVTFGHEFVKPPSKEIDRFGQDSTFINRFMRYDAQHYKRIVLEGYDYNPDAKSTVAFFPAYPTLARLVMESTACSAESALLGVSHASLAATFIVIASLLRLRHPYLPAVRLYGLALFGLCPASLFFRMGYSESLFALSLALSLLGMACRWPLLGLAFIIGAATATRAAGTALLPIFLIHLWQQRLTMQRFIPSIIVYTSIACWGIIAFTVYQYAAFGEPLAWAKAHSHWAVFTAADPAAKAVSLLSLEPVWGIFAPSSPRYWEHWEWHSSPFFSMILLNPLFFITTIAAIFLGHMTRWLTVGEVSLSVLLVLIPYAGRGYENEMLSMSRFCAIVLPVYYVIARILDWLPEYVAALLLLTSAVGLCVYSCLYASGYQVF